MQGIAQVVQTIVVFPEAASIQSAPRPVRKLEYVQIRYLPLISGLVDSQLDQLVLEINR